MIDETLNIAKAFTGASQEESSDDPFDYFDKLTVENGKLNSDGLTGISLIDNSLLLALPKNLTAPLTLGSENSSKSNHPVRPKDFGSADSFPMDDTMDDIIHLFDLSEGEIDATLKIIYRTREAQKSTGEGSVRGNPVIGLDLMPSEDPFNDIAKSEDMTVEIIENDEGEQSVHIYYQRGDEHIAGLTINPFGNLSGIYYTEIPNEDIPRYLESGIDITFHDGKPVYDALKSFEDLEPSNLEQAAETAAEHLGSGATGLTGVFSGTAPTFSLQFSASQAVLDMLEAVKTIPPKGFELN